MSHRGEGRVDALGLLLGLSDDALGDGDRGGGVDEAQVAGSELRGHVHDGADELLVNHDERSGFVVFGENIDGIDGQVHGLGDLVQVDRAERGGGLDGLSAGQEEPVEGALPVDAVHVQLAVRSRA